MPNTLSKHSQNYDQKTKKIALVKLMEISRVKNNVEPNMEVSISNSCTENVRDTTKRILERLGIQTWSSFV